MCGSRGNGSGRFSSRGFRSSRGDGGGRWSTLPNFSELSYFQDKRFKRLAHERLLNLQTCNLLLKLAALTTTVMASR